MDPLFARIWNEARATQGGIWLASRKEGAERENPLFERFVSAPHERLLLDGRTGRHVTGGDLAGFAQLVASEVGSSGVVSVLCGDRFVHAVTTTAALAAGKLVLPLEPAVPGWALRRMLHHCAALGVPTVFVDRDTRGPRHLFNGTCVRDSAEYLVPAPIGSSIPSSGHLMAISRDASGLPIYDAISLPVLWRAARSMGDRLGVGAHWTTACVTSLGAPGTYVGDVLVALANESAAVILPALQLTDSRRSLDDISALGANSFTAPVHALRHIAAEEHGAMGDSIRFAVCSSGDPGRRLAVRYAERAGHPVVAGLVSRNRPLWAALASPGQARALRMGVGLAPLVPTHMERLDDMGVPLAWALEDGSDLRVGDAEIYGQVSSEGELRVTGHPSRQLIGWDGRRVDLDAIDEALLVLPAVVDSYTLTRSNDWPRDAGLVSMVALRASLGDGHLYEAIATRTPDPDHAFVRVAAVPRMADGTVLEDDARALADRNLQS